VMRNGVKRMAEQDKFVALVARLNELTQEGKLKWSAVYNPEELGLGTDKKVKLVFQTFYKNKTLRIYHEDFKTWYEEDRYVWASRIVLTFVDIGAQSIWEFPNVAGLGDLYESVRYQQAGVDEFINDVLSENE
jgi:hypothetical protein